MARMTDICARFLADAGWGRAQRLALAGDASSRRYERLMLDGKTAVFMDASQGADTCAFARMASWLRARGYAPPAILAEDHAAGLLLLEDLGDALFARLLEQDPSRQGALYSAATDLLSDLRRHAAPDFVKPLDGAALGALVELTPRWYLPGIGAATNAAADALPGLIKSEYDRLATDAPVTSLRDYHAENLIWLPERAGLARLGLLDFQDAVAAHPAYDLVSLLQDARREVPPEVEAAMIRRYIEANAEDAGRFTAAYALLGAQRALRILGIFARLSMHFGKPRYLRHVPRVWGYLMRNLAHPALAPVSEAVAEGLPAPTAARLQRIEEQCGQYPTP